MTLRVLLVLGRNLGWRTYATTLVDALGRRDDVQVAVVGGGRAVAGAGQGRATEPRHREATRLVRDVRLAPDLRRTRRAFEPDVVHAAGHLMARPLRWPTVGGGQARLSLLLDGTARQSDQAKGQESRMGRWAWRDEGHLFGGASLVNCVSEWAARSVIADYHVAPERVRVRPYPIADIEPSLRAEAAARRSSDTGPVRLLFVGGDFERKGGPWLLDTFARRWSGLAELHVVSDTAPRQGLPDGVHVHHDVGNDEVRHRFFPAADLLVHPTRFDQSSMVAIEAAAFSLPAVVTAVGGVGEVVEHGGTGYVASDGRDFVEHVERLLDDPVRRHRLGEAARVRFLERHEADASVGRLVEDWHNLVP